MRGFDLFTLGASMLVEESVRVVDWVSFWFPFVFAEELFQDFHLSCSSSPVSAKYRFWSWCTYWIALVLIHVRLPSTSEWLYM